jgi:hypothetical protein
MEIQTWTERGHCTKQNRNAGKRGEKKVYYSESKPVFSNLVKICRKFAGENKACSPMEHLEL